MYLVRFSTHVPNEYSYILLFQYEWIDRMSKNREEEEEEENEQH